MTSTPEQIARAFEIADEAMYVQLRSYGWKRGNDASEERYLYPPSQDSACGQQVKEAFEWLRPRGYVELGKDQDGEFINVIRRPGEE